MHIQNAAGTETKALFNTNGSVELYYDNSKKIETTSGGVTVTGDLTATDILAYLDSGTRFKTGGWYSTNDSKERLYFASNSHTYIKSAGSTFFRTNNSNTEQMSLDTSGNLVVNNNITAYGSPSDENLKDNIEVIPNALDKVSQLRGVTFNYKKDGNKSTGLIAQDLEKVLPEVVYDFKDLETEETSKAVRYGNVVGLSLIHI